MEDFFTSQGLDPKTGRNPHHSTNPIGRDTIPTLLLALYVMMGGNPYFVVLTQSSPIIEYQSSKTTLTDAALDAFIKRGLVRPGTGILTVIHSINGLFGHPVIHFVQVDQAALVQQGHSFIGSKVYSLVDPRTGKSQGGKDVSITGFGPTQYSEMLAALLTRLSSASSPSSAGFARGGGGGGGAVAASHTHGGKTHSAPTCGHALCTHLHNTDAGHGAIVLPVFRCKDGSKKSVLIMGFEKGSWNFFCETMERKDNGCWIATIARALREEAKIFLSRHLDDSDIRVRKPIGRTPVFHVQLDRIMVKHDLSCGVLNAQVAADNSDRSLSPCYKEIQAIGFFDIVENRLVPLPENPDGYPKEFSRVVNNWLSS